MRGGSGHPEGVLHNRFVEPLQGSSVVPCVPRVARFALTLGYHMSRFQRERIRRARPVITTPRVIRECGSNAQGQKDDENQNSTMHACAPFDLRLQETELLR